GFRCALLPATARPYPKRTRRRVLGGPPRRARARRAMSARATSVRTVLLLFGLVAVAWAVTVERMQAMDAGPGTDLGGLDWDPGIGGRMTAAMMLPSEAPAAFLIARLRRGLPTLLFLAGYLAVWTAYGVVAYGLFRLVTSFDTGWLHWDEGGPYVAGGVIAA